MFNGGAWLRVAELALHRVLRGDLPRPRYPAALRASAAARWQQDAQSTLSYARAAHDPVGT